MRYFRITARPLSLLALLVLLAPGWAECRPLGRASAHEGMSCCLTQAAAQDKLDSGCCTLRRAPESQQVPATNSGGASTSQAPVDAPAVANVAAESAVADAFSAWPSDIGSAAGPPLFLRFSVIRR